jgi:hypothetical protein
MPIIDLHSATGWYMDEPSKSEDNGLNPKKQFYENIRIKKANTEFECHICAKKRGKGFRYIGNNWNKICHHCLEQWTENSAKTIKDILAIINNINKDLKENKAKWEKEAIVGALDTN